MTMTSTENRRWIRSSFHDWLVATFPAVAFNFGDNRTDLDALLEQSSPVVMVDWLRRSGELLYGAFPVSWPVSLTVVAKTTGDPYGTEVDNVVSELRSSLKTAKIPLYDYSGASPSDTGFKLRALRLYDDDLAADAVIHAVALTAELHYLER